MLRNNAFTIITHIAGWLIFLSLPLLFISGHPGNNDPWWALILSTRYWLFVLVYMLLFYGNIYLLVPQLFFRKKLAAYFGILLLLMTVVYIVPVSKVTAIVNKRVRIGNNIELPIGDSYAGFIDEWTKH